MDDNEFLSDGESTNGESEDDLPNNSEEETSDPFNDGEFAKFVEKKEKARGSGVQTGKSIRTVRGRGKGKLSGAAGLSNDDEDIKENYTESTKSNLLSAIKEPSLPMIKTFGDKLVGGTLSNDDVLRYFMVVALSTFLCANSSTYPSPQYLGALIDVSKVKEWNWSKFIYDWMFSSITNYRKKHRSTISGCRYFLAGYYLDYINFGVRNQLPLDLPRIHCWKGSMIKTFASYDHVSGDIYGKRPVKSIDDTCYAEEYLPEEACALFRRTLDRRCDFIGTNDMDNMCNIFENYHTRLGFRSPGTLVAKMFMYMHRTHVINHGGDASDEAEGSAARVPPPRHDDGDDGVVDGIPAEYEAPLPSLAHHNGDDDAVRAEYEAPLPSPGHFVVQDDVFDAGMAGDTSKTAVKEVDGAATIANNTIIEDVHPTVAAPTETNEEKCSMTDKIESDGLYDGSGGENCRASQSIEIIPSKDSLAEGSAISKRKRKRYASQYSSANSVASRTRLSQRLGKSPLSHIKDHNAEEGEATSAYTASPLVPTVHESETTNAAAAIPLVGTVERAPGLSR
ncbi:uncharacterized protein [Miscanthus floridulus]|uniref:uncharacterized protein n=1 Tax=Miscanthus floridulus TaxID=154761 RepID=UPI003458B510